MPLPSLLGSLLSVEKSEIEGIRRAKVVMLGAPSVGKTSLVQRFVHSVFSEQHLSTLGVKVDRKTVEVDGQTVSLLLWDMHGEADGLEVPRNYLTGARAGLLVFDRTRLETYEVARSLGARFLEASPDAQVYVVASKSDLEADLSAMSELLGPATLEHTSAKTGEGVEELFVKVATGLTA